MILQCIRERGKALRAAISSLLIASRCVVRGLPLLVSSRPRTPLRALCIIAFDALRSLRRRRPLARQERRMLAALLDLGACANAAFDRKQFCRHEYQQLRLLLEGIGIGSAVGDYLRRLENLEAQRPAPGGDQCRFREAVSYREDVVRLSLGMLAAIANGRRSLEEGIRAVRGDADLKLLFRVVMQCQIIDDVLDHAGDLDAGLPSFLTACESLPRAFELTRLAALQYADSSDVPRTDVDFPLRAALFIVSAGAESVILMGRWKARRPSAAITINCR